MADVVGYRNASPEMRMHRQPWQPFITWAIPIAAIASWLLLSLSFLHETTRERDRAAAIAIPLIAFLAAGFAGAVVGGIYGAIVGVSRQEDVPSPVRITFAALWLAPYLLVATAACLVILEAGSRMARGWFAGFRPSAHELLGAIAPTALVPLLLAGTSRRTGLDRTTALLAAIGLALVAPALFVLMVGKSPSEPASANFDGLECFFAIVVGWVCMFAALMARLVSHSGDPPAAQ